MVSLFLPQAVGFGGCKRLAATVGGQLDLWKSQLFRSSQDNVAIDNSQSINYFIDYWIAVVNALADLLRGRWCQQSHQRGEQKN